MDKLEALREKIEDAEHKAFKLEQLYTGLTLNHPEESEGCEAAIAYNRGQRRLAESLLEFIEELEKESQ